MKQHFVKTSNHQRLLLGIRSVESASQGSRIVLVTGEPGTGKSCNIDNWGSDAQALYLDGIPDVMGVGYVREFIADQIGIAEKGKFAQDKAFVEFFKSTKTPIILDEAQHGLANKAAVIEYLRRMADRTGIIIVLVCHTTEKHRFSQDRLAHIGTRISAAPEFKKADVGDVKSYLTELCEVSVDDAVVQQVADQSRGIYRLMYRAGCTLEALAAHAKKETLTGADIKGIRLCEDVMSYKMGSSK